MKYKELDTTYNQLIWVPQYGLLSTSADGPNQMFLNMITLLQ